MIKDFKFLFETKPTYLIFGLNNFATLHVSIALIILKIKKTKQFEFR